MSRDYPLEPKGLPERSRRRYRDALKSGLSHEEALSRSVPRSTGRPRAISLDVSFEQDARAREALERFPDGCTHEHIASLYGVSKELIRKVEMTALAKAERTLAGAR